MPEIRKIKRKDLDVEKYSKAIEKALNYRIYAEHWYLDVLTNEKWECWIWGDYEVVMPIPLQYKLGFKFVLQPIYCQQLGVFYEKEISDELFKEFEKKLHKYWVRAYHFNEENTERYEPKGEQKVNHLLDLSLPYEEIKNGFTKSRKKDLKKSENLGIKAILSTDPSNYLMLYENNYEKLTKWATIEFVKKYIEHLGRENSLLIYDIWDRDDRVIASQIFLISKNRKICIGFTRDREMEHHNSSAFIKNFLIKNFEKTSSILDFEGSMMKGVASFNEGFGAVKRYYTLFVNFKY